MTAFALNSLAASGFLCLLVERAKKCLDFAVTLYLIHFCICFGFSGFPAEMNWWLVNIFSLVLTAVLGEWLCMRREMRDIPLGGLAARGRGGGGAGTAAWARGREVAGTRAGANAAASRTGLMRFLGGAGGDAG